MKSVKFLLTSRALSRTTPRFAQRFLSTQQPSEVVIPAHYKFRERTEPTVTINSKEYNIDIPSEPTINPQLWKVYVDTIDRLENKLHFTPKKTVMNWVIENARTPCEFNDIVVPLLKSWRMNLMAITQGTTQILTAACVRHNCPQIMVKLLLDRWTFRQLPTHNSMAHLIKALGEQAASDVDKQVELLDDAFRVFALYPYYELEHDAEAFGAIVEACCAVNTEEAWRRALVAAEEAIAKAEKPMITEDALVALVQRSEERGEKEMAERYKSLIKDL